MTYLETQAQIIALKRTLNPATSQPFTLDEIAGKLGMKSRAAVWYYVRQLKHRCPSCLRKLEERTDRLAHEPDVQNARDATMALTPNDPSSATGAENPKRKI